MSMENVRALQDVLGQAYEHMDKQKARIAKLEAALRAAWVRLRRLRLDCPAGCSCSTCKALRIIAEALGE